MWQQLASNLYENIQLELPFLSGAYALHCKVFPDFPLNSSFPIPTYNNLPNSSKRHLKLEKVFLSIWLNIYYRCGCENNVYGGWGANDFCLAEKIIRDKTKFLLLWILGDPPHKQLPVLFLTLQIYSKIFSSLIIDTSLCLWTSIHPSGSSIHELNKCLKYAHCTFLWVMFCKL